MLCWRPCLQDLVIYEMPLKAFTSCETSGLPAPERGTFKGVAEKVCVQQECLSIPPVIEDPLKNASSQCQLQKSSKLRNGGPKVRPSRKRANCVSCLRLFSLTYCEDPSLLTPFGLSLVNLITCRPSTWQTWA